MAILLPPAVDMPARCKTGLVVARTGWVAHTPAGFNAAFEASGRVRFRAEFLCGNATNDALVLTGTEDAAVVMCTVCEDAAKGPCVYRCFNSASHLIYIGSAKARLRRLMSHESASPWWPEVDEVKAEHYPTLIEARVAERLAIAAESPLYNKHYRRAA